MNKKHYLFSSLLALAALPAAAQSTSSVTVYGVADVFLQAGKVDGDTSYAVQSGGLSGSRLGFEGSEDLGNGLKGVFLMEHGMALDTGTVTQGGTFWGRQVFVGLSSSHWGNLFFGRQYTPHFNAIATDDPFGTGAGSSYSNGILTTLFRINNAVIYELPKLPLVSGSLLAAPGEGSAHSLSGHLRLSQGPWGVSVSGIERNTAEKYSLLTLSGSVDFGVLKLQAGAQKLKNGTGAVGAKDDRDEWFAGLLAPLGGGTVSLGLAKGEKKDVAHTEATQWSAGYSHDLSKRTTLYGVYSSVDNAAATAFTTDAATGTGPATTAGKDVRALQLGIRHRF